MVGDGARRRIVGAALSAQLLCSNGHLRRDAVTLSPLHGPDVRPGAHFSLVQRGLRLQGRFLTATRASGTLSRASGDCAVAGVQWSARLRPLRARNECLVSHEELVALLRMSAFHDRLASDRAAAGPSWRSFHDAWRHAQTDAALAYQHWRTVGGRDPYTVYRAAQDRADAAQDTLATATTAARFLQACARGHRPA